MDTGNTKDTGQNKMSWLEEMELESISDSEDIEKIEQGKATGRGKRQM